ncbi:hypothetical protein [Cetobacterium sp.]
MWNNPNDPMPIEIANGKTLEQCVFYRGGGITVYTDNSVTVKSYPGFYDYYLANERKMSEVMMLPVEGEEVVKDEEYYKKLINGLAIDYNKQVENAPNLYKSAMVLQDVNTPAPIYFACTVFVDKIWIGEGYSVGTADRPPCPVNVPSGKLAFVTNATSDTHSFVGKDIISNVHSAMLYITTASFNTNNEYYHLNVPINEGSFVSSKSFYRAYNSDEVEISSFRNNVGITEGLLKIGYPQRNYSFTQLLIYKANLTETELKVELAKDIKLR